MTFTPEDFDAHFDKWKNWPTTPWNRLLYSTSHRNFQQYLGPAPLKILDAGGGNGEDTLINPYSETYRQAIFQNHLKNALAAIGQDQYLHPWFGKSEKRHAPETLIEYLEALGCKLLGHYGLRNIVDYLTDNESKFDSDYFAELEKLEHALTNRYPYYLLARMFQIIVQK